MKVLICSIKSGLLLELKKFSDGRTIFLSVGRSKWRPFKITSSTGWYAFGIGPLAIVKV